MEKTGFKHEVDLEGELDESKDDLETLKNFLSAEQRLVLEMLLKGVVREEDERRAGEELERDLKYIRKLRSEMVHLLEVFDRNPNLTEVVNSIDPENENLLGVIGLIEKIGIPLKEWTNEHSTLLRKIIQGLTERQKEVLNHIYFNEEQRELSRLEVAKKLNLSKNAIKGYSERILNSIKKGFLVLKNKDLFKLPSSLGIDCENIMGTIALVERLGFNPEKWEARTSTFLRMAINQLTQRQKEVLFSIYLNTEGRVFTQDEAAEAMGITQPVVDSYIGKAIARLKSSLEIFKNPHVINLPNDLKKDCKNTAGGMALIEKLKFSPANWTKEDSELLMKAIDSLTPPQKEALELVYLNSKNRVLSYREAGEVLKITDNGVRARLERAIENIFIFLESSAQTYTIDDFLSLPIKHPGAIRLIERINNSLINSISPWTQEHLNHLVKIIESLTKDQKRALIARYLNKKGFLSHEEGVKLLNWELSVFQNHLTEAMEQIKNTFRETYG